MIGPIDGAVGAAVWAAAGSVKAQSATDDMRIGSDLARGPETFNVFRENNVGRTMPVPRSEPRNAGFSCIPQRM